MTLTNDNMRALHFQTDFTAEEFKRRRCAVMQRLGGRGTAVLQGAPPPTGFDVFRQTNEFYYLCGVEVPQAYLLMDAEAGRSVLYLLPRNERHERSEGPILCAEDRDAACASTGVDDVRPIGALPEDLRGRRSVHLLHAPAEMGRACRDTLTAMQKAIDADPMDGRPSAEALFRRRMQEICPDAEVRDLSLILDELRLVKSPAEVAVMRRAGHVTSLAITEAMRATRPGMMEYQLGALADYVFLHHGARGGSYRAIIGGGGNAWLTHYWRNDCPLRDGDLVLMDYAPDIGNYTSDVGRMWPVNGRYAPWQRELYGLVVEYHKTLLSHLRPGPTPEQVMAEVAATMQAVIDRTRFSKPAYEAAARKLLPFQGHLSHPVGMAVHDVGNYFSKPLVVGTVFAIDPQMWVPEEKLYIRCEDTVVVTDNGIENLTGAAPLELDEVEALVGRGARFPL